MATCNCIGAQCPKYGSCYNGDLPYYGGYYWMEAPIAPTGPFEWWSQWEAKETFDEGAGI